jgi:hypothetical protein
VTSYRRKRQLETLFVTMPRQRSLDTRHQSHTTEMSAPQKYRINDAVMSFSIYVDRGLVADSAEILTEEKIPPLN